MSTFEEAVEKKIDDPKGRLTRLIKFVSGEPKELIKNCIQQPAEIGYEQAMQLLKDQYGDPYKVYVSYRKEIQKLNSIKPGDAAGFRKYVTGIQKRIGLT